MRLGNKLFWLCQVYTLFVMGLFVYDFTGKGAHPVENNLVIVYLAILTAYAGDKELGRWASRRDPRQAAPSSKGSLFVVLWALFYAAAYCAHLAGADWKVPEGMARVVVSVLGVFFGTSASKRLFMMLTPEGAAWGDLERSLKDAGREPPAGKGPIMPVLRTEERYHQTREGLMQVLGKKKDWISISEIIRETGLSRSTALRHLAALQQSRQVRMEGERRSTRYRLA